MKEEKYKCPLCQISHNDTPNENNIINLKEKNIICSSCINKLLKEENNLIIPNDLISNKITEQEEETDIDNNNISKKDNNEIKHELNKSIIDEIKRDSKNKTLIQELKQQINNKQLLSSIKSEQNILNISNTDNPLNLSETCKSYKNIQSMKNYYVKKTVKVKNIKNENINFEIINSQICDKHSLPLNMICMTENIKICAKCALNNDHLYHKIISQKEYLEYINELNKIYNIIENNENTYNNFNQKFFGIIEEINDKFIKMESQIAEIKKDIIDKINNYFTEILNFIYLRRKEIFDKFQYCNYDLSELVESSLTWMKTVKEKNNFFELLNLLNAGKQLNNRYNFVKEINEVFNILNRYKDNGMTIIKNEYKENPIIIQENREIIKLLNLTPYEDLSIDKNINANKAKTIENSDMNNNISTNIENTKVYCKKIIDDKIRHNNTVSDFYKNKNKRKFKPIKSEKGNIKNTNSVNFNRISVSRINNNINNYTESNESTFPFFYSTAYSNGINSEKKSSVKKSNILEYKKKNESIQIINETDNNTNINFNGHIFNYNSDNNISIIFPVKNKNKNLNKKEGKNIIKNKRKTPQKINMKKKMINQNFKRCFSFDENINSEYNTNKIQVKKNLCLSNNTKLMNMTNNYNSNTLKIRPFDSKNYYKEKTFINLTKKKSNNRNQIFYKTLSNKELEKYVNYQLKKEKTNFNRINLHEQGIKLITSYFNMNKNKRYKEMQLQGCNLNGQDLKILIKSFLENDISTPVLSISDNNLNDECIESIIDLINQNNEIIKLILVNNSFSKQAKNRIKEIIKKKKEKKIDLNIRI